jgi:hypothetical protein
VFEVKLGLLSDGGVGVERRLDAVPQAGDVHGRGGDKGGRRARPVLIVLLRRPKVYPDESTALDGVYGDVGGE